MFGDLDIIECRRCVRRGSKALSAACHATVELWLKLRRLSGRSTGSVGSSCRELILSCHILRRTIASPYRWVVESISALSKFAPWCLDALMPWPREHEPGFMIEDLQLHVGSRNSNVLDPFTASEKLRASHLVRDFWASPLMFDARKTDRCGHTPLQSLYAFSASVPSLQSSG